MSDEDLHRWLPSTFTGPIAAKLLRTTTEALYSLVRVGAVSALPGESILRFSRHEVERILGRLITASEYLQADREHDARRAANQRYNKKRRSVDAGGALRQGAGR